MSDETTSVVTIFVADEQTEVAIDAQRWFRLATAVLDAEGVGSAGEIEMSLLFVDEENISVLNERYMGKKGPTDVLAFPIDEIGIQDGRWPDGGTSGPGGTNAIEDDDGPDDDMPLMLGDVLICPRVARDNAPEHAGPNHDGSLEDELALLVVHGILHLLGLDHHEEAEAEEMETRERDLLARFHVSAGRPVAAEAEAG